MSPPRWLVVPLSVIGVGILIAAAGIWGAMRSPRLVAYTIDDPRWPAAAPPLRIVQLSDTHANDPFMTAARLRGIVRRVNALRPDLVVLTGDYVGDRTLGGSPLRADAAVAPLRDLRARLGRFAVLGNHDHDFDAEQISAALRRAGIGLLVNSHASAGPVTVAGVDDAYTGRADVVRALGDIDAVRPAILLSHSPDIFPEVDGRFLVTLAGHTHGGQIALPLIGPPLTASHYGKRYAHGHIIEQGRHLIVSAGLGTSLLPMRIGVPPEIVLVTIR